MRRGRCFADGDVVGLVAKLGDCVMQCFVDRKEEKKTLRG